MKKNRAACIFSLDGAGQWSYVPVISKGNQARLRENKPMTQQQPKKMLEMRARIWELEDALSRAAFALCVANDPVSSAKANEIAYKNCKA